MDPLRRLPETGLGTPSLEIRSPFEEQLFRDGVMEFNWEEESARAEGELSQDRDALKDWSKKRLEEAVQEEAHFLRHGIAWKAMFQGKVPKNWDSWMNVGSAFRDAKERGAQLSETLMDAGITHPNWIAAQDAGKAQRMNRKQLVWFFLLQRPFFSVEEVLEEQKSIGTAEADIKASKKEAQEYLR